MNKPAALWILAFTTLTNVYLNSEVGWNKMNTISTGLIVVCFFAVLFRQWYKAPK